MKKMLGDEYDVVRSARDLATTAHSGQKRKGRLKEPYIVHPEEVAELVALAGGTPEEIAGALLHDACEDNPQITIKRISELCGEEVSAIVEGISDPPSFKGLPLESKKRSQALRLETKSISVRLIKLADMISNLRSLASDPPENWSREECMAYIRGTGVVADKCEGISRLLTNLYSDASRRAFTAHSVKPTA